MNRELRFVYWEARHVTREGDESREAQSLSRRIVQEHAHGRRAEGAPVKVFRIRRFRVGRTP